jgi:hypothetical protein
MESEISWKTDLTPAPLLRGEGKNQYFSEKSKSPLSGEIYRGRIGCSLVVVRELKLNADDAD